MKRFGDDEWAVVAEIARMYYVEGRSQQEIANQLFFSKAKVSRALRLAREENVVEFHINYPSSRSTVLETELKRRFGLKETLVVTDLYDNLNTDISIKRIGKVAASYLDEILKDGDTIGVSWGRTIYQTVRQYLQYGYGRIHDGSGNGTGLSGHDGKALRAYACQQ